ncbi:hypothetical protein HDU79_003219 [Rhizoclosmatium sp. JEL0117]|nr:hypothetical protein HDU79_003219 [Rhizoclosmatium sp. JEL0117]
MEQDTRAPNSEGSTGRGQKLLEVFDKSVSTVMQKFSTSTLATCFPAFAETRGTDLDDVAREMVSFVSEAAKDDFGELVARVNAVDRLDAWDKVLRDATKIENGDTSEKALHTWFGPAESVGLRTKKQLRNHISQLKLELAAMDSANTERAERLAAAQKENEQLREAVARAMRPLVSTAKAAE